MFRLLGCLEYQHDPKLVAVAATICILSCFTASSLLSRSQDALGRQKLLWIAMAAVEFGCGVWALHFIAMLAFMPALHVSYNLSTTLWSVVIAVLGAFGGFMLLSGTRGGIARTICGAVMLTLAVGGMHYTGIASMRLQGRFGLDPTPIGWSFVLSGVFCMAAVIAMRNLRPLGRKIAATLFLSAAICSLHFVGMSAMSLEPGMQGMDPANQAHVLPSGGLAIVVASSSIALVLVSLALSIVDRLLFDRATAEQARLRKLAAVSFEGLLIEQHGVIVDANDRLCAFSERALEQLVGTPVTSFLTSYHLALRDSGADPQSRSSEASEHVLHRASGREMPVELLANQIEYRGKQATAVAIRDLTAKRDSEVALHHLAHHDPLTGLANRLLLETRMRRALANIRSPDRGGAVLCLDLDRFKSVNDLLGHAAGDQLLVAVSQRLSALLRQSDTLARLGGDEFVILLPELESVAACQALAARIIQRMSETFDLDQQQVVISVSIGIALFPSDGQSADQLLRCADIAMYCSKDGGRGTYRLFAPEMDAELQKRHNLERDLRAAIESQSLALHYQPLVSCETGDIEGYEALLRWNHPVRGFVLPADFIPIAEESGLILPLGYWVLRTACETAASWDSPFRVAVNLSPVQFRQTDLVDLIVTVLRDSGLPATRLEIEVTEGVLIDDPERAVSTLSRLRSLGVRVSLDDFGTGYSSLSYLRQFPLDKIKIDRSFIMDLGVDERSGPIVRAVVALAHSLGLCVTAEGVETQEQLDLLRDQSCNQVQGFLLGHPAAFEATPKVGTDLAELLLFPTALG